MDEPRPDDDRPDPDELDADPWVIPLREAEPPPPASRMPAADPPPLGFPADEVPSDLGFHPRLRRSA